MKRVEATFKNVLILEGVLCRKGCKADFRDCLQSYIEINEEHEKQTNKHALQTSASKILMSS